MQLVKIKKYVENINFLRYFSRKSFDNLLNNAIFEKFNNNKPKNGDKIPVDK